MTRKIAKEAMQAARDEGGRDIRGTPRREKSVYARRYARVVMQQAFGEIWQVMMI